MVPSHHPATMLDLQHPISKHRLQHVAGKFGRHKLFKLCVEHVGKSSYIYNLLYIYMYMYSIYKIMLLTQMYENMFIMSYYSFV